MPPGLLHAPGSLYTYEPQAASDVSAVYQSMTCNQVFPEEFLWKNTPPERRNDLEYLLDLIDWDLNVDPDFVRHRFMRPLPVCPAEETEAEGYAETWICYKSPAFSAKELTVLPGATATIRDSAAYGLIMVQGHGAMGPWDIETPALIRYGQCTRDEYFVSETAARAGARITNASETDPLVMLKHFGPGNPDLPEASSSASAPRDARLGA